jgi:hypothetical protein
MALLAGFVGALRVAGTGAGPVALSDRLVPWNGHCNEDGEHTSRSQNTVGRAGHVAIPPRTMGFPGSLPPDAPLVSRARA